MSEPIPQELTAPLQAVLSRVRRMRLLRGLAGVATVFLGGLMAAMAADFLLAPLPAPVRWILLAFLVGATGWAAWAWIVQPLRQKISLVQVARWIETRHPEIQERVSTAMELSGPAGAGASEVLLRELLEAARGDVEGVDPVVEVRTKRVKQWMGPAIGLAAAFLALFAFFPGEAKRLLVRAVAPFSDLGNAGALRFIIKPQDVEVLEGEPVRIVIAYSDPSAAELTLVTQREGMEPVAERLQAARVADASSEFVYTLPAAQESFRYHAKVGKARSDSFDVTVWPLPQIENVEVEYKLPDYTGAAPLRRSLGKQVAALVGTEVDLVGSTTTPVERGRLLIDGAETGSVAIERSADGARVKVEWNLQAAHDGTAQVMLVHPLGREIEGLRFSVKGLPDQPPVVTLVAPSRTELKVRPDEALRLEYEIEEDVGVAGARVELQAGGREVEPLPASDPVRDDLRSKPIWRGEEVISMGRLLDQWEGAREFRMRIAASDVLPERLGGPGVGYSDWLTVAIDAGAESLVRQEIREQQSDARESLAEAAREVQEAKERMDRHQESIKQDEVPERAQQDFAEARQKLAASHEQLNELAARMEQGVHAAKAEAVREAARQAAESRVRLEDMPLQDSPEGRAEELKQAREAAQAALEQLRELQDAVQQDEGRLEQLAQLSELAQRENEVARQAEKSARQDGQEAPADIQLERDQKQIEQELQSQVERNQEAKAAMLGQQAEAAAELGRQARELSDRQEGLAEALEPSVTEQGAAEQGQPRRDEEAKERMAKRLTEQLAAEQAAIVEAGREQLSEARENMEERANFLPEAVADAQDALQELEANRPEAAAGAAREAADSLAELALPSARREEAVSDQGAPGSGDQEQASAANDETGDSGERGASERADERAASNNSEVPEDRDGSNDSSENRPAVGENGGDAADPELASLAERQERVARALESLDERNIDAALQAVQEMQADQAAALTQAIQEMPQLSGAPSAMPQAAQQAREGRERAEGAAQASKEGQPAAASQQHGQSSDRLAAAAEALQEAAEQFSQQAQQAAAQEPDQNQLPGAGELLAEALEAAAQASKAQQAGEQAATTRQAAQALAQAAKEAMQAMQSGQQAGQPGQPGQQQAKQPGQPGEPGGQPGDEPREGFRPEQADSGVPPELAELGVSAKDWEKLKAVLRSDVGGGAASGIPEDYRSLVKRYFQEVAKGGR